MLLPLKAMRGHPFAPFKSSFEIQDQLQVLAAGYMVAELVWQCVKAIGLMGE